VKTKSSYIVHMAHTHTTNESQQTNVFYFIGSFILHAVLC